MVYAKPQAEIRLEFKVTPTEVADALRALIIGPHANLHRYSIADEKNAIRLGAYDPLADAPYSWPGRTPGSLVDYGYTKLFIEGALLRYLVDDIGSGDTITAVSGRTNHIQADSLSFKQNGVAYARSAVFKDRDVRVGDVVHVSADDEELWSTVAGFASDMIASTTGAAAGLDANQDTVAAAIDVTQIGGTDNDVNAVAVAPSDYDGLAEGDATEQYTIEVIRGSTEGAGALLKVTSASGHDDVAEVEPEAFGNPTAIGTRGVEVTWDNTENEFVVGQKWRVTVTQAFTAPVATSSGTYAGAVNDTYIVTVSKGGKWADLPEITVTTAKGRDLSGPTEVTGAATAVPIGSQGVSIAFSQAGLRKGDKYTIAVTSQQAGPVRRLILKHDLSEDLLAAEDLRLQLFIKDDIEVSQNRLDSAPETNWDTEETQIIVNSGITAYHGTWTDGGEPLSLPVRGGTLYVEYREWLTALVGQIVSYNDVGDLEQIAGPLHPDNPLKYGLYKAIENSGGAFVRATAVSDPDSLDDWADAISTVKGKDTFYNFAPLTFRRDVQNLIAAQVQAESNEKANNWKGAFVGLQLHTTKAVVTAETSGDGEEVLAILEDDPDATGTQFTRLRVPGGNANFLESNVRPGDIVRYLYTTDGFDEASYQEFTVDEVLSENTLRLFQGHDEAVTVPQKIEVYHAQTKDEMANDLATQAGSFASTRICSVWPDIAGSAGTNLPGYYLAASLAGLVSGVAPHQGLTNVEIAGYDDLSRAYEFFNSTQLDRMAEAGVWICTQDRNGVPHTRHALTTLPIDANHAEEVRRRNADSMAYVFFNRMSNYIGKANVTPSMIRRLEYEVDSAIKFFQNNGYTEELGPQLIEGKILTLQQHPLLRDGVECVLEMTGPFPLNHFQLTLQF